MGGLNALLGRPTPLVHAGVSDDLDLLIRSLSPAPGRRFLSVSAHGAGEAALTLAAMGADRVLAYDVADPFGLDHLLALKLTAAHLLGREDYLAVMGLRPASRLRRRALADQVLRGLVKAERAYWLPRRRWLLEGLFFCDQQARFFAAFRAGLGALAPAEARRRILGDGPAEARVAAFRAHVRRGWLERLLEGLGARVNLFFPEAEWNASEYPRAFNQDPLGYLEGLVAAGLDTNPLFAHLCRPRGAPLEPELLPPHLRPGAYDGLRTARDRVRVVLTRSGERLPLTDAAPACHGAYLSNVVDYLGPEAREALLADVVASLAPGAPILVYSNEAFSKIPASCGAQVDAALSEQLAARDRARIYRRVELLRVPGTPDEPAEPEGPRLRVVQ